jgi:tetraacyldisaccharide 4'-kinase
MTRVLFVTNGHGEASIAQRIAAELRRGCSVATDHFALVGRGLGGGAFADVGPQAAMPSGGLVAMGNVAAFSADLRAGFPALFGRQLAFAAGARARYRIVVAVGDVYALLFALLLRRPAVFVGTAKSVYVAPYGPVERRLLRRARRVFVRDAATAAHLQARGVAAESPGNVIADLLATDERVDWGTATERIVLLPGSRERAYADAARLADVARRLARNAPASAVRLSIAPGLDPSRFASVLAGDPPISGWAGDIGALLADATLALGQAGTANEAAAACGVPVVAFEFDGAPRSAWYRMRQARLLGDALAIVPGDPREATEAIAALLADPQRRARMARAGRERMGGRGGAAAIAAAVAALAAAAR